MINDNTIEIPFAEICKLRSVKKGLPTIVGGGVCFFCKNYKGRDRERRVVFCKMTSASETMNKLSRLDMTNAK